MIKRFTQIILIFILTFSATFVSAETYKIGCIKDYYPYTSVNNNGELEGILIDWWELLSKKTGVKFEYVPLSLQACLEKTQNGEIDAIAGLFYNESRAKVFDFSEPIMRMRTALYLEKGLKFDSIQNITAPISVVEKSLAHLYLQENYPQLKLNVLSSHTEQNNSINQKQLEAFTYDIPNPIGKYKFGEVPEGYYEFATLVTERLRPAVKKGDNKLLHLIISGVEKISDNELAEIVIKWNLFEEDNTLLWWSLGIGFCLLVLIAYLIFKVIQSKKNARNHINFESKTDWQVIIDKGENDLIEFKSSLRWDYRQEKVNKALEQVIVKTISAFLNTEGGMLFIGVGDDGNALGLQNDYQSLSKNSRDGFLLALTNLINQNMGKSTHKFITINIISINEKDVCIVTAEKSDKPVFIGKGDNEEFYIRASASSQPLGMSETFKYISSHWS